MTPNKFTANHHNTHPTHAHKHQEHHIVRRFNRLRARSCRVMRAVCDDRTALREMRIDEGAAVRMNRCALLVNHLNRQSSSVLVVRLQPRPHRPGDQDRNTDGWRAVEG